MLQRHLKLPHQLLLKTLLPQHAHLLVSTGKNLHSNGAQSFFIFNKLFLPFTQG